MSFIPPRAPTRSQRFWQMLRYFKSADAQIAYVRAAARLRPGQLNEPIDDGCKPPSPTPKTKGGKRKP